MCRCTTNCTTNETNRLFACETMSNPRNMLPLEKGVVCIGFDDYNADQLEAVEHLASLDVPCYLSVIPSKVEDEWNMAKTCYSNGGEICAHSIDVLTPENQTFEMMNEKFVQIPKEIGQHGFPVYGVIRAGGTEQGTEDTFMDEFFCRSSGLKYSDYYGVSKQFALERKNITRYTLSELEAVLDDVAENKKYVILFCHHVNGTEKNAYPNGFNMSDFKNVISAIQDRDVDIMTINQLVDRYIYGFGNKRTDNFSKL